MQRERFSDLIERARRGDRSALDRALRQVDGPMRTAANQHLTTPLRATLDTSDLLQTTYVDVVRSIDTFRGETEAAFRSWVRSILDNNARDKIRAAERSKRKAPVGDRLDPDKLPSNAATPSRVALDAERIGLVGRALDGLEADYREVLVLRMIEGRDYEDVARALDRSVGATRMLYFRARAALALEIDEALGGE